MPEEVKKSDETKVEETDTTKITTEKHDKAGEPEVHTEKTTIEPKAE